MRWFGESWGAPICREVEHIETPAGEDCTRCGEFIEAGDQGVTLPEIPSGQQRPYHLDCFLRETLGSVGHILRRCSCFVKDGTAIEDPPHMTKREAATAAVHARNFVKKMLGDVP